MHAIETFLASYILMWPLSLICTHLLFKGQRQWYLISVVACIAFGIFGFFAAGVAYRVSRNRKDREAVSNLANSRMMQ